MAQQPQPATASPSLTAPECFVFDACAFIAYFNNEAGADKAEDLIDRARNGEVQIFATSINVYEVYYDSLRHGSQDKAEEILKDIYNLPLTIVESIDRAIIRRAAYFKTKHKMSVADSFALALAKKLNAKVVSTDHHEFDAVEKAGELQFFWLR